MLREGRTEAVQGLSVTSWTGPIDCVGVCVEPAERAAQGHLNNGGLAQGASSGYRCAPSGLLIEWSVTMRIRALGEPSHGRAEYERS